MSALPPEADIRLNLSKRSANDPKRQFRHRLRFRRDLFLLLVLRFRRLSCRPSLLTRDADELVALLLGYRQRDVAPPSADGADGDGQGNAALAPRLMLARSRSPWAGSTSWS